MTNASGEEYAFVAPPVPGIHPRICFTPSERPLLRQRTSNGPAAKGLAAAVQIAGRFRDKTTDLGKLSIRLLSGDGLSDTEQTEISNALRDASFAAYAMDDKNLLQYPKAVLLAFVRQVKLRPSSDYSRTTPGIALSYDWLYEYLTTNERVIAHDWIVDACQRFYELLLTQNYGFKKGSKHDSNWTPYIVGAFGITALSIEGEAGYRPTWFTNAVSAIDDFLNTSVGPEGSSAESIHYFAYGMANGAFFINAMARRGQDVLNHTNLNKIPTWWTYDLYPWGRDFNDLQDTRDIMMGIEEPYDLFHLAYPKNKLMQWVYLNYRRGFADPQSQTSVALWATEPSSDIDVTQFNLPLSKFFSWNGLAYLRSNWTTDGLYVEFQSDPVLVGPSHAHSDRNSFTLAANGNLWITDSGGWLPQDIFHNLVFIDGKAEGYFPHRGHITKYKDAGWATGIVGDAKNAYDWRTDRPDSPGSQIVDGLSSFPYNPVLIATRTLVMVRGMHPYVIVADDIQKDYRQHSYDWRVISPLGNTFHATASQSGLIEPEDISPYIEPDPEVNQPVAITVPFDIKSSGNYNLWITMGRDYWTPYWWGGLLQIDQNPKFQFAADCGDNSHRHPQRQKLATAAASTFLSAGHHKLSILPFGTVQFSNVVLALGDFDPRAGQRDAPSPPITVSLADIRDLPLGWKRVGAGSNPAQLSINVISPSGARIESHFLDRTRPDAATYSGPSLPYGPEIQISARVDAIRPNFRTLLFPRHRQDPVPKIQTGIDQAVIQWDDSSTDTITFSSGKSISEHTSIKINRRTPGKTYSFDLAN